MSKQQRNLLSYPPSAGDPVLREAVSTHISTYRGVVCDPSQIVIVSGTQQGLNLLAQLLLERGDHVAVEDPGYPAARLSFEARDLVVTRVPVDDDGMQVDRLPSTPSPRMIHVTASHQDPTGATMSLSRRLALIEFAEQHDTLVLEDDYDSEFRFEGRPVESLQGLDRTGSVVYAGTFSKSVLPSLRIGFLVLPDPLVRPFIAAKSLWDSGAPLLEQATLAEFLSSGDFERHIRRMRRLYRTRRDALVRAISRSFGASAIVGQRHGGLNLLVTLDVDLSEADVLYRAETAGVGLRGASSYYRVPPSGCTLLVGFAAIPENAIEAGIHQLASAVLDA